MSLASKILNNLNEVNVYTDYNKWLKSIPPSSEKISGLSDRAKYSRVSILSENIDRTSIDLRVYLSDNADFFGKVSSDINKVQEAFVKAVDEDNETLMSSAVNSLNGIIEALESHKGILAVRNKQIQNRYKLDLNK